MEVRSSQYVCHCLLLCQLNSCAWGQSKSPGVTMPTKVC
jgi:hypothetical protein